MKNFTLSKFLFLGICLIFLMNGCDVNDDKDAKDSMFANKTSKLFLNKSANFDWNNYKVEVSFEDDFEKFMDLYKIEKGKRIGHVLTENNLKQGLIVKLKSTDYKTHSVAIAEIMIEPFDLKNGENQLTIGHINSMPYIIY